MRSLLAALVALLLLSSFAVGSTRSAKRVALIIGNGKYEHTLLLPNPKNDARLMASSLRGAGFDVIEGIDLKKDEMLRIIDKFTEAANGADIALVYYSGHGMQVDGQNFLLPVDAELTSPVQLRTRTLSVESILSALPSDPAIGIVILDACRDNPLARSLVASLPATRSAAVKSGLAVVQSNSLSPGNGTGGTLIAYATDPGAVALDGSGSNSPYTQALAKYIVQPGLELQSALTRVRGEVTEVTMGRQRPWYNASIGREVFLSDKSRVVSSDSNVAEQSYSRKIEQSLWDEAVRRDTQEFYNAYLQQFPDGRFSAVALLNVERLKHTPITHNSLRDGVSESQESNQLRTSNELCKGAKEANLQPTVHCLSVGNSFTDTDGGPVMVVIPSGTFTMGSPSSEDGRQTDEGPQMDVTLVRPMAIGKYQVTRGEFSAFVEATHRQATGGCNVFDGTRWVQSESASWENPGFPQNDSHPATCVSWEDAQAYTLWLQKVTGKRYRLPSEAEFEYAARAKISPGRYTRFWFGNSVDVQCQFANGPDLSAQTLFKNWDVTHCTDGYANTSPVGTFSANEFGLYDMAGNLWHWVEDCYSPILSKVIIDGSAQTGLGCDKRVLRGGSWIFEVSNLRAADRHSGRPIDRFNSRGFRVARSLD
ncbi:SUMF1/EgtB/PvdO family nonheme iron enzyme [Mesorhizobium sp. LNHC209A00]|uniref:SUMF1/EgtB/PvdO family nonheme iron enzyme n=1 Tax=Mesorhizobium TaxID=68287 RepID=UPI0004164071|nr:SUMF1/EgtB/PvdO family nonheme iron enzyme [Mesorhizobium sp. LNHC209A00]